MDTSIACPRCGANLVLESDANQVVCDFCGAHLSVSYENNLPQFTIIPEPEKAAPDLSQFSPEVSPDAGAPEANEPVPAPEPISAPEPILPPQEPVQVTETPSLAETPISVFTPGEPPQKKKTNTWLIVAIVAAAVLCLCCLCIGIAAIFITNSSQTGMIGLAFL